MIPVIFGALSFACFYTASSRTDMRRSTTLIGAAGLVFMIAAALTTPQLMGDSDCWTEWDGRSNQTVCN